MALIPADREAVQSPAHRRRWVPTGSVLRKLVVPSVIIGAWIFFTVTGIVAPIFLPSPADLLDAFQRLGGQLPSATASSVLMTLVGFFIGLSLGLSFGLMMAYSRSVRDLFGGFLDFIRPVPVLALIPLFVLWFGIGRLPQITLIALGVSVILGVTTREAIRNVPPVFIRAGLTLGATRWHIYRTIIVPSILPHILGAIRVAAAASWGLDVAAEFIGAQNGLGYLMIVRRVYLDTAGILLIVIIYSVLALTFDVLIRMAERPLLRWTDRGMREGVVASMVGQA